MALLDPTTPEGRLLMFKKDILPGRIEYAERCKNDVNAQDAQDSVNEARKEIRRLERLIHPVAAMRADAGMPGPTRFKRYE